MDATAVAPAAAPPVPFSDEKRLDLILDALKAALATPGDHRLFRSGKLAGLFPSRAGASADAALAALTDGLLETTRTEAKGRHVVEWVRATPKGVTFVHDRDSPKAVLRELKELLGATRAGVPAWMDDARRQVAEAAERFERQGQALLARLDDLTARVDAALRRADTNGPGVPESVAKLVPWAIDALAYLDRRRSAGAAGPCRVAELFDAVRAAHPALAVPAFHDGLRRLHDVRAVRLRGLGEDVPDPEFTLVVGAEVCGHVER